MGCDIHMYVERLEQTADDSKKLRWVFQDSPEKRIPGYDGRPDYVYRSWYDDRNYTLFGYLANVRNDLGWGTSKVRPISTPRGVPKDATREYRQVVEDWGVDGHSHSYFTLRELVQAAEDQTRIVEHRGWVTPREYAEFLAEGKPSSWCGGVGGGNVQHISNARMAELIVAHPELTEVKKFGAAAVGHPSYYTEIRWRNPIHDNFGDGWADFIKTLQSLTFDDGSDVRAVFFFDN